MPFSVFTGGSYPSDMVAGVTALPGWLDPTSRVFAAVLVPVPDSFRDPRPQPIPLLLHSSCVTLAAVLCLKIANLTSGHCLLCFSLFFFLMSSDTLPVPSCPSSQGSSVP